jgi:hypothetical protein
MDHRSHSHSSWVSAIRQKKRFFLAENALRIHCHDLELSGTPNHSHQAMAIAREQQARENTYIK